RDGDSCDAAGTGGWEVDEAGWDAPGAEGSGLVGQEDCPAGDPMPADSVVAGGGASWGPLKGQKGSLEAASSMGVQSSAGGSVHEARSGRANSTVVERPSDPGGGVLSTGGAGRPI